MPAERTEGDSMMTVKEALEKIDPSTEATGAGGEEEKAEEDKVLARVSSKSKLRVFSRKSPNQVKDLPPSDPSPTSAPQPAKVKIENPFQFAGDGVELKAKFIGIQEVPEPTGDQMCQDAMLMAKALQKNSGNRKQRVVINVCLKGLTVKDEKTSEVSHNFPITRISFVTRDTRDSRAFGFVVGCRDTKHKFYAFKSPHNALRAVSTIRDMFHVAFETRKTMMEDLQKDVDSHKIEGDSNGNERGTEAAVKVEEGNLIDLGFELEDVGATLSTMEIADWHSIEESQDDNTNSFFLGSSTSSASVSQLTTSQDSFLLI